MLKSGGGLQINCESLFAGNAPLNIILGSLVKPPTEIAQHRLFQLVSDFR